MDIKSKKMRKITMGIIALVVLLPAVILVGLYPRMGQEYSRYLKKMKTENNAQMETAAEESLSGDTQEYELMPEFINYAMEASYYLYGQMLQEVKGSAVDFSVLDEQGWINDYYSLAEESDYYARILYGSADEAKSAVLGETDISKKTAVSKEAELSEETAVSKEAELSEETTLEGESETTVKSEETVQNEAAELLPEPVSNVLEKNQSEHDLSLLFLEKENAERKSLEDKLAAEGILAYLKLEFDEYGNILNVELEKLRDIGYYRNFYAQAKASIDQYENNVNYYNQAYGYENGYGYEYGVDPMELRPKSFQAVFTIGESSQWVSDYSYSTYDDFYYNAYNLFAKTGAPWLILAAGILVALMALILPFFKKLETGWEKIFSMPAEIIFCIIGFTIAGFVFMYELMIYSSYPVLMEQLSSYEEIRFIGYEITPDMVYYLLLFVNFIGWAAVFFMEYISVAALRQFLSRPLFYLKNRVLAVRVVRYIWKQCKRAFSYVTDINITDGLKKSIWKIVIANFLIVGFCCCFWFVGWFGVVLYSVLLYVLLKKYGSKLQSQYGSILYATKQMAEGNLKTDLPDDLGIFTELGMELKKVQTGFSKAVAEEAKSQNMKTELITNVSHDLKTPLTAIITYVDLLKKEDITQEERKIYIDTLERKSQRLKVLIEDLFEVSKASTNNITMEYKDVDIVNLLKQVRLENEDKISESTLDIRFSLPEKKCVAYLDPNRTYRIMDNLLQNALKYSMPHSRVYVDLEELENEYVIRFRNMSAVEMNFDAREITERFVRGDLSRNTEGSGLGLAIAQSFTELQNGKFTVEIDGDLFKVILRFPKIRKDI